MGFECYLVESEDWRWEFNLGICDRGVIMKYY